MQVTMNAAKQIRAVFVLPDYAGYDVGRTWTYTASYDGVVYQAKKIWTVVERRVGPTGAPEFVLSTEPGAGSIISKLAGGYYRVGSWSTSPYRTPAYQESRLSSPEFMHTDPIRAGDPGPGGSTAAKESVTVPAGTFADAWRYTLSIGGATNSQWLVPYVGMVKFHATGAGPDGTHTVLMELFSVTD